LLKNIKSVRIKLMKIQKNIKWAAAIAAVCLAAYSASAQCIVSTNGNLIGAHFADGDIAGAGNTAGGVMTGLIDCLNPSEIAGIFPQPNWNNLGRFGDSIPLVDSNGCDSGVSISWYSSGMWGCNAGTSAGSAGFPNPLANPDDKLMDGFLDPTWGNDGPNTAIPPGTAVTNVSGNAPIIFLTGMSSFLAAQGGGTYTIVVYVNSDAVSTRQCDIWIQKVTGPSSAIVTGATNSVQYYQTDTAQFNGSNYTQVPVTSTNVANIAWGNYMVFPNQTDDEILIRCQDINSSPAAAIHGIQIFAPGEHVPPQLSASSYSPTNVVFAGSPMTVSANVTIGTPPIYFQWETDGGTGGGLDPILNATNVTLNVSTPSAGTFQYCCIGSNVFGVASSPTNALTVLPASAPLRTADVSQYYTNVYGFIGGSVTFGGANFGLGTMPITNQWLYSSGGAYAPVAGVGNNPWTLTNVLSGSGGNYKLSATNAIGSSNSTPAHLTALADPATPPSNGATNMYSYCVMTNLPWAYWKFEETNDTLTSSMQAYDYSGHNFDATYGNSDGTTGSGCLDGGETMANGQYGPGHNDNLSGFTTKNGCATMGKGFNNGYLTVPPLNLNTNTVTFTMWIYINPVNNKITPNTGLLMNRNGFDAAGIGFGGSVTTNDYGTAGVSIAELGYNWNQNSLATYGWHSHLYPALSTWNFVACTITPSSTTLYLYFIGQDAFFNPVTNLFKAINLVTNGAEAFSGGTTWIGSDNWDNLRTFDGYIDEVAVFTNALTEAQIQNLFLRSIGLTSGIPPLFSLQPANQTVYQNQNMALSVSASAIPAPWYQWWFESGTSWSSLAATAGRTPNGSTLYWTNFGATSLTITNFRCVATNFYGAATSSVATVTILPINRYNAGWTVNFNCQSSGDGAPNTPYVGHGVLGNGTYWNGLRGNNNFSSTPPSLWDDGISPCPVNVVLTNYGNGNYGSPAPYDSVLLDQFMNFGTNGTSLVLTNVPAGRYNLAVYNCVGSYVDRATAITVYTNGVSAGTQNVTNAQDTFFLPDNTVVYSNLLVTSGSVEVHMIPGPGSIHGSTNTEGDFNGVQLQFVSGPLLVGMTNRGGTNDILTYYGGFVLQSTNMAGPWTTNTTVGAGTYVITNYTQPPVRFFKVWTNKSFN
jgi:hypothetical protein